MRVSLSMHDMRLRPLADLAASERESLKHLAGDELQQIAIEAVLVGDVEGMGGTLVDLELAA